MISLGLGDGLNGLSGVGTHSDLGHVHIAVLHGDLGKALLLHFLTGCGKLADLADVGGLGSLSAGVGIDLSIKDEDVHILLGGDNVIQSAVADVVGPAIATEDPHGLLGQILLLAQQVSRNGAGLAIAEQGALCLQLGSVLGELRIGGQLLHGADALLQSLDKGLGGLSIGGAIVHGVQPSLSGSLQLGTGPLNVHQAAGLGGQILTDLVLANEHAQAVLGVILKEGVAPCGAVALLIGAVGRGSRRTAPDGGAAGGVGDIHMVAEDLGHQTGIAGLGAAGAGAGELQHGLLELAALDGIILHILLLSDLADAVIKHILLRKLAFLRNHRQGAHRAHADTHAATHAIQRRHGHGVLVHTLALAGLHIYDLGGLGSVLSLLGGQREGTDGSVGADIGALVALDALGAVPGGNGHGYAALLIGGGAQLKLAVHMVHKGGNGQAVAVHLAHGLQDLLHHLHKLGLTLQGLVLGLVHSIGPIGGDIDLLEGGGAQVDGLVVHIHHVLALLQIRGLGLLLHVADGVLLRHDLGQGEEGGLENGVVALAHADLDGQVNGVDGVELDVILGDVALGIGLQMMVQLVHIPLAVDHEHAAGLDVIDHLEALGDIAGVVAGHKVGLVDIIRRTDGLITEAQMADGDAAGLLGVVLEVGLHILVGMVADDLDRVLVCADSAVAAQTPELALDGAFCGGVRAVLVLFEREVRHVVHDADGELMLRLVLLQFVVNSEDGSRRRILGAEAVAAANDGSLDTCVGQSGHNVHVQRLAQRAGLLRAVEDCNLLGGSRDGCDQLVCTERTVQANLNQADFLAVCVHVVDNFLSNVVDGAHRNNDAVSVGGAVVVEQLVVRAEFLIDLAHVLFDNCGQFVIVPVAGLAVLEEDITVFRAAGCSGFSAC